MSFANAGHQPPLLHKQDNTFEELPATAPSVGIMSDIEFPAITISLDGGSLYVFTDGVTEAMDESGQELEVNGLIELIKSNSRTVSSKRLNSIVSNKIRRPNEGQHDDITILLIECS